MELVSFNWFMGVMAAGYGWALATCLIGRGNLAWPGGLAGVAAGACFVAGVFITQQRPPLVGPLESIMEMALLLGVLAIIGRFWGPTGSRAPQWAWAAGLILLAVLFCLSRSLQPDSFMFNYPGLIVFFQLRLVAMVLLLYAAACFASAWSFKPGLVQADDRRLGRLLLLAGLAAFLVSEFSGTWWSYHWTGGFWRWNRGFLESAALFLVISIPLHLPGHWASRRWLACSLGMLPGLAVTTVTIIHQVR